MDSGSLSRQNSAGSMTTMTTNQMSNKTSRTNLSEASADTGIMGDIDNKVCCVVCFDGKKFWQFISLCTVVWKNEKFGSTKKIFRQINYLVLKSAFLKLQGL